METNPPRLVSYIPGTRGYSPDIYSVSSESERLKQMPADGVLRYCCVTHPRIIIESDFTFKKKGKQALIEVHNDNKR